MKCGLIDPAIVLDARSRTFPQLLQRPTGPRYADANDRSMAAAVDIVILFLGRGHTSGDALVYLPKEKIIELYSKLFCPNRIKGMLCINKSCCTLIF